MTVRIKRRPRRRKGQAHIWTSDERMVPRRTMRALVPEGMGRHRLADLPSRCTVPGGRADERLDPYWSGLWETGSSAHWSAGGVLRRQVASGLQRSRLVHRSPAEHAEVFMSGTDVAGRLGLLATLDQWRTVTLEQARAMCGVRGLCSAGSTALASGFGAGLLDIGVYRAAVANSRLSTTRSWLLRVSKGDGFDTFVAPHLTWPQWVSVTGGSRFGQVHQFDRHNVLAVEAALRAAEFCPVGTVMGEKMAGVEQLFGSGIGKPFPHHDGRSGDAVIVRPDGLRIVLEVTASTGQDFGRKVRRWAEELAASPLQESGVVVVFVAAQPLGPGGVGLQLRRQVAQAVKWATRQVPGDARNRTAERLFVVDWREWFPAEHECTDAFLGLRASRPTGGVGHVWEQVDLVGGDGIGFEPWNPEAMLAVLRNSQHLLGVPFWLRDLDFAPRLWRRMLHRVGLVEPLVAAARPGARPPRHPAGPPPSLEPFELPDVDMVEDPDWGWQWGSIERTRREQPSPFPRFWPERDIHGEYVHPQHAAAWRRAHELGLPLPPHPDEGPPDPDVDPYLDPLPA